MIIILILIIAAISYLAIKYLKKRKLKKKQKELLTSYDYQTLRNMVNISQSELILGKRTKEEFEEALKFVDENLKKVEDYDKG